MGQISIGHIERERFTSEIEAICFVEAAMPPTCSIESTDGCIQRPHTIPHQESIDEQHTRNLAMTRIRPLLLPLVPLVVGLVACTQKQAADPPASPPSLSQAQAPTSDSGVTAKAESEEQPESIEHDLLARAMEGNDQAVQEYAERYLKSEFGKPSIEHYRELLESAAGKGSAEAKARLGSSLIDPSNDKAPDAARGAKLLSEAASSGNEYALRKILWIAKIDRVIHPEKFKGITFPHLDEAVAMVRTFEKQFHDSETNATLGDACETLALYTKSPADEKRFQQCANEQLQIAYERKNLSGAMSYAMRLEKGDYIRQDLPKAARIYKEIVDAEATKNMADDFTRAWAASRLAHMEFEGRGVPKNFTLAKDYAIKASAMGQLGLADVADLLILLHWPTGIKAQRSGAFPDAQRAYGWSLVAVATEENPLRRQYSEILEAQLTAEEISRVQDAVAKREEGKDLVLGSAAASLSGILCARHIMTQRSMYATQDKEVGGC